MNISRFAVTSVAALLALVSISQYAHAEADVGAIAQRLTQVEQRLSQVEALNHDLGTLVQELQAGSIDLVRHVNFLQEATDLTWEDIPLGQAQVCRIAVFFPSVQQTRVFLARARDAASATNIVKNKCAQAAAGSGLRGAPCYAVTCHAD